MHLCQHTLRHAPSRCQAGQQQLPEPACDPQPGIPEQALWCLDSVLLFPFNVVCAFLDWDCCWPLAQEQAAC